MRHGRDLDRQERERQTAKRCPERGFAVPALELPRGEMAEKAGGKALRSLQGFGGQGGRQPIGPDTSASPFRQGVVDLPHTDAQAQHSLWGIAPLSPMYA